MIICIVAGGKGSRLWPISTNDSPKQTQRLYNSKTLIENTYGLMKTICDDVFIISEISHSKQLSKLVKIKKDHLIVEPERKGTLNCILYAVAYINNHYKNKKNNEQICFIHADHVYDNNKTFSKDVKTICACAKKNKNIFIASTKPTYPATKFGYIETTKTNGVYIAKKFIEKPNLEKAKELLKTNKYVWNEGMFVCSYVSLTSAVSLNNELVETFKLIENNVKNIKKIYSSLKNECIENGLYVKCKKLMVFPINFKWTDIGTYSSLYEVNPKDDNNNVLLGEKIKTIDCTNNLIINKTDKPLVVIKKNDCVIVSTDNGTLIVDKKNEDDIKKIS